MQTITIKGFIKQNRHGCEVVKTRVLLGPADLRLNLVANVPEEGRADAPVYVTWGLGESNEETRTRCTIDDDDVLHWQVSAGLFELEFAAVLPAEGDVAQVHVTWKVKE